MTTSHEVAIGVITKAASNSARANANPSSAGQPIFVSVITREWRRARMLPF
jgi:hypothetical protein